MVPWALVSDLDPSHRWLSRALALVVVCLLATSGCIRSYSTRPLDAQGELEAPMPDTFDDAEMHLSQSWATVHQVCAAVAANMEDERRELSRRNRAIRITFGAASAVASVATIVYSFAVDEPDPMVTAILAGVGGLTAVPTFFFLGTDEREVAVSNRLERIRLARENVERLRQELSESFDQWQQLEEQRALDQQQLLRTIRLHRARREVDEARARGDREAAEAAEVEVEAAAEGVEPRLMRTTDLTDFIEAEREEVRQRRVDARGAFGAYVEAQHALWNGLEQLRERCR